MGTTVQKMLRDAKPDRLMIEASGLAHAASVIDELKAKPLDSMLEIGAVFTVVDPRQFINPDYAQQALYKDQIGICDVLVASKTDLCTPEQLAEFHDKAAKLFPPKAKVAEVQNAQLDIQWLDIPVVENRATASKPCRTTPWAFSLKASLSLPGVISTAEKTD